MNYQLKNKIRIVTAASLFDGHDAAINIMRRILQSKGAEIIHLGHNRSVAEIVECAIEEDAQGIAITSYQGGHVEFFKYMKDLLDENGCGHIKIFGGGGGTILPQEIKELHDYGITRIYSPDDGRKMGLEGMIEDVIRQCDFHLNGNGIYTKPMTLHELKDIRTIARQITNAENGLKPELPPVQKDQARPPVVGITGTGGAGKSSVTDELVRRYLNGYADKTIAVISVDPSKKKTGGALLGDRIRMNAISSPRAYMRSLATRESDRALSEYVQEAIDICRAAAFDLVVLESAGVGQSDASILDYCDISLYVMTPEYGAASQLEKINMLDYADIIAINKFDKAGALDALHDVRKQYKRNHQLWTTPDEQLPVVGTIAAQFNDEGVNQLFRQLMQLVGRKAEGFATNKAEGTANNISTANSINTGNTTGSDSTTTAIASGDINATSSGAAISSGSMVITDTTTKDDNATTNPDDATIKAGSITTASGNTISAPDDKSVTSASIQTSSSEGQTAPAKGATTTKSQVIPPKRVRYLSEITDSNRQYDQWVDEQASIASRLYQLTSLLDEKELERQPQLLALKKQYEERLHPEAKKLLEQWPVIQKKYGADYFEYQVRDKTIRQPLTTTSLSGTRIPKVVLPRYKDWGDLLRWQLQENIPGEFPYTAGVFELKRQGEDPTRMFAGEGGPERTNKRFHYVSVDQPAKRLSTAFDSVTLYGEDPAYRPDIYGKIGNSGVSIATVDDAKKLYSGFDLCDPKTSVSMTINGPAPMLLAFFMNAAIDQQCEQYITEHQLWDEVTQRVASKYKSLNQPRYYNPSSPERLPQGNDGLGLKLLGVSGDEVLPTDVYQQLKAKALSQVRGTVQADILKEDQAQNTCIFSTEFALKLMGDVQQYFIEQKVRNFYSVSISGYHIAEAGANPITQLAFTLANGFTYVEYYLSRGMNIDDFAPNLSFFFSNGMDPEYSVIGRVARRIWAKAIKLKYRGNDRSQKLKYHIQTSGRSLHAQEIDFNDIRTTLQALYAIYDNCNSLHTNAYDEAITTPTEESVRRAMAIQLIINRELGSAKTENFIQGSFAVEELTDLVESAVLAEFDRITERGGVLGAMERMYQRNKIQEESLYYEHQKHTGELPLIGVNTFLSKNGSPTVLPGEVIRSTREEKEQQIQNLHAFHARNEDRSAAALQRLQQVAVANGNLFAELMETVKSCSLGQITRALYEVGGQYRRNM